MSLSLVIDTRTHHIVHNTERKRSLSERRRTDAKKIKFWTLAVYATTFEINFG